MKRRPAIRMNLKMTREPALWTSEQQSGEASRPRSIQHCRRALLLGVAPFVATIATIATCLPALELPPGFVSETLATNLNAATAIVAAPDGRIFIADQTGRVNVWKNGSVLNTPALVLHVTDY